MDEEEDGDAFALIFQDEDLSPEEREELRLKAAERRREERRRKEELKRAYELQRLKEEEEHMRKLREIQEYEEEQQRRQAEEAKAELEDAHKRLQGLDFGSFAFGGFFDSMPSSPSPLASISSVKEIESSSVTPAKNTAASFNRVAAQKSTNELISNTNQKTVDSLHKDVVQPTKKTPPPVKPKPLSPKLNRSSATAQVIPEQTALLDFSQNQNARGSETVNGGTVSKVMKDRTKNISRANGEPRRRKVVRGGNSKQTPVLPEYEDAVSALQSLEKYLDPWTSTVRIRQPTASTSQNLEHHAGPIPTSTHTGLASEHNSADAVKPLGQNPEEIRRQQPPPPVSPKSKRLSNVKGTSTISVRTESSSRFRDSTFLESSKHEISYTSSNQDEQLSMQHGSVIKVLHTNIQKKPPRRKLVRGGNAYKESVLPEFADAMSALEELEGHLNPWQNTVRIKLGRTRPQETMDNCSSTDDVGIPRAGPIQSVSHSSPDAHANCTSPAVVASTIFNPATHAHFRTVSMEELAPLHHGHSTSVTDRSPLHNAGQLHCRNGPSGGTPISGEPRRRKLVRGGNKKETPVLPEYEEAVSALDELNYFLDQAESVPISASRSATEGIVARLLVSMLVTTLILCTELVN